MFILENNNHIPPIIVINENCNNRSIQDLYLSVSKKIFVLTDKIPSKITYNINTIDIDLFVSPAYYYFISQTYKTNELNKKSISKKSITHFFIIVLYKNQLPKTLDFAFLHRSRKIYISIASMKYICDKFLENKYNE